MQAASSKEIPSALSWGDGGRARSPAPTNTSGQLANTYTYDPNGNRTTQTGTAPNTFGFQGGYQTTRGLYHYSARYYNPAATTFTQQDPIDQPADLLQADRYLYAGDNPINLMDLMGRNYTGVSNTDACGIGAVGFYGFPPLGCGVGIAANSILNAIF